VGVGVGEQDRELVASRAGEQVALVQLVLEAGANCAEQVVSHVVAAAVADFLEAVQVAQQDRVVTWGFQRGGDVVVKVRRFARLVRSSVMASRCSSGVRRSWWKESWARPALTTRVRVPSTTAATGRWIRVAVTSADSPTTVLKTGTVRTQLLTARGAQPLPS
jgi:hypothetical protein